MEQVSAKAESDDGEETESDDEAAEKVEQDSDKAESDDSEETESDDEAAEKVEQDSDKAESDDSEEMESDDEATEKDKAATEGSGSGLKDSDNEHERGERSVSAAPIASAGGETQEVPQNTLWGDEKPRSGSEPIVEETPLGEKEADKATNQESERAPHSLAAQPVPSHDVETSASSAFISPFTTPHRFQIKERPFEKSPLRDQGSNEAYPEGNASMTGDTSAAPQPKRRKTTAGKSVPGHASPASMPSTGENVEDDKPVTTLFGSQAKGLTELGTAKYPAIQNNYGITLADVIDLRGNSRDKGAYEAYKAAIEVMPSLYVERLLPRILAFGDALKARDRAVKAAPAKKSTAPLARLAQAFEAEKEDMLQQVYQHVAQMRIALDVKNRRAINDEEKAAIGGTTVGRNVASEYYDMLTHYETDCVLSPEAWVNRRTSPDCLSERKEWGKKRAAGERIVPFVETCPGLLFLLPDWMSPKSLRAKTDIWPALLRRAMKGYERYELLLELGQIFSPWVEALIEDRLASWEVFGGRGCFYESCLAFTKNKSLFSTFSGKQKTEQQEKMNAQQKVYMTALDSELDDIILDMSPFPDAGHTLQLGEIRIGITKSDMEGLKQGGWLSDNAVNGLIGLVTDSPEDQTTENQSSHALIESLKWQSDRTYNRTTEVAYNRRTLIPICIANHWMLLLVVPPNESIWLFDSLVADRSARLQSIREQVRDAFKVVGHDNINWSLKEAEIAHQTNGNDCGAHVIINAVALSQGDQPAKDIETLDIPRDRLSMGQMIARRYWEQRIAAKLAETETETEETTAITTESHGARS